MQWNTASCVCPKTIGRFCRFCEHSGSNFVRPASMEAKLLLTGGAAKSKNQRVFGQTQDVGFLP
ncbi:hypothetical protein BRYFOR_05131 [Marvinbryantia formatexigens DSM 14469]|uniref:Uncharacterized protein n=1 Tax=Marvinbryantia formatexigens DSM 14469 TaxID=478749 RepID=C6L941_9FIRM|nr:hypothetical protein BRYFOR_05131 [Marvinbryantia formatexigens DSM 14469]